MLIHGIRVKVKEVEGTWRVILPARKRLPNTLWQEVSSQKFQTPTAALAVARQWARKLSKKA